MANEIRVPTQLPSKNVYALIGNKAGKYWNGSAFETYVTANRDNYDISLVEQGTDSGIYIGTFPAAITSSGTYDIFAYLRTGATPAEPPTDVLAAAAKVDWTGTATVGASTGAMSASDFKDYILRCGFKRTDKDTELYEAVTDTIQVMRRRFMFTEAQAEKIMTDTITVLGDFKLTLETDFGLLLGIVLEDGADAWVLEQLPKWRFDELYPDINVTADRGFPQHYAVYAGAVYFGPIPDRLSYAYRKSYSLRAGTISASTAAVPFTDLYREILKAGTLERLWRGLDQFQRADLFRGEFEAGFAEAMHRETINRGEHAFTVRAQEL